MIPNLAHKGINTKCSACVLAQSGEMDAIFFLIRGDLKQIWAGNKLIERSVKRS